MRQAAPIQFLLLSAIQLAANKGVTKHQIGAGIHEIQREPNQNVNDRYIKTHIQYMEQTWQTDHSLVNALSISWSEH
jgi:hypothetical protein